VSNNKQWKKTAPLALAAGMICLASTPLRLEAQSAVVSRPTVVIDNSVLEQLGPPSNLPELLLQHTPAPETQKVVLTPPGSLKAAIKEKKHKVEPKELTPVSETVHLHPVKHHSSAARPVRTTTSQPAAPVAKDSAPAILTPTLSAAATPTVPSAVTSEPLAPPPSKAKAPVTTPVPPPVAAAPMPAPAAAAANSAPPVALTAQPATTETASAAPAQESLSTINFDKESARLPDTARETLAHLASRMSEDATLEVQLLAYAAGDEENASKARRLSLSRALAVRSFLIDQGVRSTRIEVRALGNKVPEGAPDRVDIAMQKRG